MIQRLRLSQPTPAMLLAGILTAAAVGVSACSSPSETASSGAQPSPVFSGANSAFCGELLAANDHSAAAEEAKAAGDTASVQSSAASMYAAVQNAMGMVPENAPDDVKRALRKYSDVLERAIAGADLGDQAHTTVKDSAKIIKRYYGNKCHLA